MTHQRLFKRWFRSQQSSARPPLPIKKWVRFFTRSSDLRRGGIAISSGLAFLASSHGIPEKVRKEEKAEESLKLESSWSPAHVKGSESAESNN